MHRFSISISPYIYMASVSSKKIIFTVTNDISYDQRMSRICTSLANAGYDVTIIGFERVNSIPLAERPYRQIRIKGIPEKGKMLYFKYWIKLYRLLLQLEADAICAIDLDTILPVYRATRRKGIRRVYDAHEIFTELKEVVVKRSSTIIWGRMAKKLIPRFPHGYTIGKYYAQYFRERYGVSYEIVRNATVLREDHTPDPAEKKKYILYQGAVNHGRCFEQLIPAMKAVDADLIICGNGNFFEQAQALTREHGLTGKIHFKGYIPPAQLREYTREAAIGITLFEADNVLSNYYSMANRFFDYMHHGVAQLCNAYPEYVDVNKKYEIAVLVPDTSPETIADALNKLVKDDAFRIRLGSNALEARKEYCWQEEEKRLLNFYDQLFR